MPSRFPTQPAGRTTPADGADAMRATGPSAYDRTPTAEQPDGMRPPVIEVASPFGPLGVTVQGAHAVSVHGAWEGYPAAEYADELPADHPQHVRQFMRVARPVTINGKAYTGTIRFEVDGRGRGIQVTHYAGLGAGLTDAARRRLSEWAWQHWAELTPSPAVHAADLARANSRFTMLAADVRTAREALADAERKAADAERDQARAYAALRG